METSEEALYKCALEVEKDKALSEEMKEWDIVQNDIECDDEE